MDITAAASAASVGTTQSAIVLSLMQSTEQLAAVQADILMASLGVGANFSAYA